MPHIGPETKRKLPREKTPEEKKSMKNVKQRVGWGGPGVGGKTGICWERGGSRKTEKRPGGQPFDSQRGRLVRMGNRGKRQASDSPYPELFSMQRTQRERGVRSRRLWLGHNNKKGGKREINQRRATS